MKIAIFHQFMDNIGGAELVALALARGFNADIYTTSLDPEKIKAMGYEDIVPRIISVGTVPKMAPFRQQLALWKMRNIDANKLLQKRNAKKNKQAKKAGKSISDAEAAPYDFFIIAGDWAVGAAVKNKPNLWYIHSPLNELWHFRKWIREELLSPIKRPLFDIFVWFNRMLTRSYAKHAGIWVTNSKNVQARTKLYYGHDSTVINPPIDISKSIPLPSKGYWLSVNRLFRHKRVEIQMEAFKLLPNEKLIVVGSYEKGAAQFESYKSYIEGIKPANVEIMHWVDDAELRTLYAECKGFITSAKDEDFGMTAVEAMAYGKPVIAPNEGGYMESVVDGKTGILIDDIDAKKLAEAVTAIPNANISSEDCIARAKEFDVAIFIQKIKSLIDDKANR